ncbi:MAG TPA: acyl-CoA thioesterase [Anaerohalosphaeraceae bacterium]|nr:acyl-CoA thioesterase [Anaerohalosphaeraceae bacterium]HOL32847.1 acyl-CoA thioesterase [Anaerohalosphaeraceae bacterium]HPO69650.1 acyl-CoA thioesterase [Anaerohalosphaeraceae bacterium]HRS71816.1 acyl-CoA thioesterase [Anaerohalosphaeraceae bacterium]HRV20972.1 acyl-CoA thioesterase [Anaerohalosphaeraceae bacterium]
MDLTAKTPSQSAVESRYLVMPQHANPFGTAFGGVIMSWIDMAASMAAQKHCGTEVVTVSIDSLSFEQPIRIGDQVVLRASVNYVSRTSMEVGVKVLRENPITNESTPATKAYLTFVAIDAAHRPIPAPPLVPQTEEEKRRAANAALRVRARKLLRQQVKTGA